MTCRMKVTYCSRMTGMEAHRAKPRHSRDVKASEGTVEQSVAAEAEEPGSEGKRGCLEVSPRGSRKSQERSERSKQNQVTSQYQRLNVDHPPPTCQSNVSALPSSLRSPNSLTDAAASEQAPFHSCPLQPRIRDDGDDGYYYCCCCCCL